MNTNQEHYDIIIIGTGAGGGTVAHELAPTGKKILLLERGEFYPVRKTTGILKKSIKINAILLTRSGVTKKGKALSPRLAIG